jgi:hypothetical protein
MYKITYQDKGNGRMITTQFDTIVELSDFIAWLNTRNCVVIDMDIKGGAIV